MFSDGAACAKALLECCDPDLSDATGNSALHLAAAYGANGCAKVISDRAGLDRLNRFGLTAADLARAEGHAESADLIVCAMAKREKAALEAHTQPSTDDMAEKVAKEAGLSVTAAARRAGPRRL